MSSEKAKTLTQEVNAAISKKVILVAEPVEANKNLEFQLNPELH